MKNQPAILTLLLAAAILAVSAGCAFSAPPSPAIAILSPRSGTAIPSGSVPISVQVSNFKIVDRQGQASVSGEGHLHFYLDPATIPQTPGQPAVPSDKNARWAHVSGTSYTFTNVSPGMHTIAVQLVNNDHTPVIPLVYKTVTVSVEGLPPAQATTPTMNIPATPVPATTIPLVTRTTPFHVETPVPASTRTTAIPTTTVPPGGGTTVRMNLTARNVAFDQSTLSAPAGSTVIMTFVNNDFGVTHNFALYTDLHATTSIFVGDFITGSNTATYTFTVPSTPGSYFFRCDVHPETMTGTFTVT
jgi:plastocyanin